MIFKTITSSIDSSRKSIALFNKDWNTCVTNFRNASGLKGKAISIISSNDINCLRAYNQQIASGIKPSQAYRNTMTSCTKEAKQQAVAIAKGTVTIDKATESIKKSTLAATANKIAMSAMSLALNIGTFMLVSAAVSKVVSTFNELRKSQENLRQSASELGSELSNNASDIESYKKRIDELKDVINDSSSSFDEVSQARVDLMVVQDELIDKFGTEKGVIESITSAINDQTDALDELSRRAYFQKKNEFNEKTGGDKFADWLSFGNTDDDRVQSNMDKMVDKMQRSFYELKTTGNKVLDDLIAKSYGLNIVDDMYGDGKHFQIYGTLEEIQDKLYGIQQLSQDFELSTAFENSFTKISNDVDDALVKYKNLYDQYVLYEKILTDNPDNQYDDQFDLINKAKEAYNKAVQSGNEENIKKYAEEYNKTLQSAIDQATNNYDYDVADYFTNMYPELQQMFSEWQFELNFEPNVDGLQDKLVTLLDRFDGSNKDGIKVTAEELKNFNPNTAREQDQISIYAELCAMANQYGMSIDALIDKLQKMGLIQSESYQQLVDTFGQENVDKLSPEDLKIAYTIENAGNMTFEQLQVEIQKTKELANGVTNFNSFSGTYFGERIQHITKLFNEGSISCKEYFDALQSEINNFDASNFTNSLEEANKASAQFFVDSVQQVSSGLSSLINSFNSGQMSVSEYLEGYLSIGNTLSTLTDNLQENSEEWNKNGDAIADSQNDALDNVQSNLESAMSTIESYQDSIYSLEQILTDSVTKDTDEFKAHINVIADDLANIVQSGGEMADEVANTLGTTTSEIAQNLTNNVSNQELACEAIMANTNSAISNMAEAVGSLFETLGNEIANFKVDLTFSPKIAGSKSINILGKEFKVPEIKFELRASGESLSNIGDAISGFGKAISSNIGSQTIDLDDFHLDNTDNYSPSDGVKDNYNKELNKLKEAGKKAGKDAGKAAGKSFKDGLKEQLSDLDSVISGITSRIDDNIEAVRTQKEEAVAAIDAQIDALNEQKSALEDKKKALEEERDARIEVIEQQKKQLELAIKAIDKQIKQKEKVIKGIQDEINSLKNANEQRKRAIDLQKAQYDLERLQQQRTKLVA